MTINSSIQFHIHNYNICLRELVYYIANEESKENRGKLLTEFCKTDRLRDLLLCGEFNGLEEWSWKTAIDKGWLSRNDLEMFKEEIEKEKK